MSWREEMQAASFRGIPFFVDTAEKTGGRRLVVHEYPQRDEPFVEDLGRRARAFQFDGYVIGEDYMAGRDALVQALEKEGPGTLVHPYEGALIVSIPEYRLRESIEHGGMAHFTISCVEAGENREPEAADDTTALVEEAADEAIEAAEESFADTFDVEASPQWIADSAGSLLGDALGKIGTISKSLPALPLELAGLTQQLGDVQGIAGSLLRDPGGLAGKVTGLMGDLPGVFSTPEAGLKALTGMLDFGAALPAIPTGTISRALQAANQGALLGLVKQSSLAEAVRLTAAIDFPSYDDAVAVRDDLTARLDTVIETGDDKTFAAFSDLKVAMVRDINARGANLARVMDVVPNASLPALVHSYNLYGDAGREAEIVARNALRHPGFAPGGQALEVLTRVTG